MAVFAAEAPAGEGGDDEAHAPADTTSPSTRPARSSVVPQAIPGAVAASRFSAGRRAEPASSPQRREGACLTIGWILRRLELLPTRRASPLDLADAGFVEHSPDTPPVRRRERRLAVGLRRKHLAVVAGLATEHPKRVASPAARIQAVARAGERVTGSATPFLELVPRSGLHMSARLCAEGRCDARTRWAFLARASVASLSCGCFQDRDPAPVSFRRRRWAIDARIRTSCFVGLRRNEQEEDEASGAAFVGRVEIDPLR